MKKYPGMCSFYKGTISGKAIEAESISQLLRLASIIANKEQAPQHILYVDYVYIDKNLIETTPLPKEYYVRLAGRNWKYQGSVPVTA